MKLSDLFTPPQCVQLHRIFHELVANFQREQLSNLAKTLPTVSDQRLFELTNLHTFCEQQLEDFLKLLKLLVELPSTCNTDVQVHCDFLIRLLGLASETKSSTIPQNGSTVEAPPVDSIAKTTSVDAGDSAEVDKTIFQPNSSGIESRSAFNVKNNNQPNDTRSTFLDRYEILREHAKGGLGAVFVAYDVELRRNVAVKQILTGLNEHAKAQEKFETEAIITGQLEHPGIVPVYGFGRDPHGNLFYAMRFIEGEVFSTAIRNFHQSVLGNRSKYDGSELRRLLRSLMEVAFVMQFAHSRGVVHRDLKPLNIILGKNGETLVLDWGLAKHVIPSKAGGTGSTQNNQQVAIEGTIGYSSPQQLSGLVDETPEQSDVYSLGAILFEILTNKTSTWKCKTVPEGRDCTLAGRIPTPRETLSHVPAGLNEICKKAMQKDVVNRYQKVEDFRLDVERWLDDEPISCMRDSFSDRMFRAARKNRSVAITSAFFCILITLLSVVAAGIIDMYRRESVQLAYRESQARIGETKAKETAITKEKETRLTLERMTRMRDYLTRLLRSVDPIYSDKDFRVVDLLDVSREEIPVVFANDQDSKENLLEAIAASYSSLGHYEKSQEILDSLIASSKASPAEKEELALRYHNLAETLYGQGMLQEAETAIDEAIRLRKELSPKGNAETTSSEGLRAVVLNGLGRKEEAFAIIQSVVETCKAELGEDHPQTLMAKNNLATSLIRLGEFEEALLITHDVMDARIRTLGATHPDSIASIDNHAGCLAKAKRLDEAIRIYETYLGPIQAKLDEYHPSRIQYLSNLAGSYSLAKRPDDAFPILESIRKFSKESNRTRRGDYIQILVNIGSIHIAGNDLQAAIEVFSEASTIGKEVLPENDEMRRIADGSLGMCYLKAGEFDRSIAILTQLVQREKKTGQITGNTLSSIDYLIRAYSGKKDYSGLLLQLNEWKPILTKVLAGQLFAVEYELFQLEVDTNLPDRFATVTPERSKSLEETLRTAKGEEEMRRRLKNRLEEIMRDYYSRVGNEEGSKELIKD